MIILIILNWLSMMGVFVSHCIAECITACLFLFNYHMHEFNHTYMSGTLYCDILWVYMYLKVGTTHFYRLALYNLVLGLTDILLKSKLFKWWMLHGDMTMYSHATILGVLLGQISQLFINLKTLFSCVMYIDFTWTAHYFQVL